VRSSIVGALTIPNYRLFAAGQLASNTGTWMQRIAQDWLVLQLTDNSGLALGITSMLQALPMLLFGMWGGVIADRYPKRTVLILTQIAMGSLAAILGLLPMLGTVHIWHVYLLALGLGIATVFDQPTRQSFIIEMVGRKHLPDAVTINSIIFNGARIIGPALAGFAIGWVGIGPMFLLNAASYLVALAALMAMRREELETVDPVARGGRQLRAGLSYVGGRVTLLLPVMVIGITSAFGQTFQVLLPLLAKQDFGRGPSDYGMLIAALALGSLSGAMFTTKRRNPRVARILGAAVTFGVFEILTALMPTYWTCFAILVPAGVATLTLNVSANAGMQMGADPCMRGRAMALFMVVLLSANSLGSLILGAVAEATSVRMAIASGGAIVVVGTGLAAMALARRYRMPIRQLLRVEIGHGPDFRGSRSTESSSPSTGG
jgi:MFS family permease